MQESLAEVIVVRQHIQERGCAWPCTRGGRRQKEPSLPLQAPLLHACRGQVQFYGGLETSSINLPNGAMGRQCGAGGWPGVECVLHPFTGLGSCYSTVSHTQSSNIAPRAAAVVWPRFHLSPPPFTVGPWICSLILRKMSSVFFTWNAQKSRTRNELMLLGAVILILL